jgi:hypothetical protein
MRSSAANGRIVDGDDDVLRDGQTMRVPLMMRDADGLTDLRRSVCDHFSPAMVVDAFGDAGGGLHRPGSRYLVAGAGTVDHAKQVMADHLRREARDEYVAALQSAWKNGTNDREVARVHDTGDARDSYLDQVHDLTTAWSRRR